MLTSTGTAWTTTGPQTARHYKILIFPRQNFILFCVLGVPGDAVSQSVPSNISRFHRACAGQQGEPAGLLQAAGQQGGQHPGGVSEHEQVLPHPGRLLHSVHLPLAHLRAEEPDQRRDQE